MREAVFEHPEHPVHPGPPPVAAQRTASASRNGRSRPSRATCPRSGRTCRPACSSTAARWRRAVPDGRCRPSSRSRPVAGRAATIGTASARSSNRPRSSARTPSTATRSWRSTQVSKTFHQSGHDVPALVKVNLRAVRRRDARAGRRVRLGQVDPRPDDPRHREPGRRRQHGARRAFAGRPVDRPADRRQALDPDGLPEPGFGPEPGLDRPAHPPALRLEADRAQGQGRR